jgi:hypothetical protein
MSHSDYFFISSLNDFFEINIKFITLKLAIFMVILKIMTDSYNRKKN